MNPAWVFDASALLAWIQAEPGQERVSSAVLAGAAVSAANWAEALSKTVDRGRDVDELLRDLTAKGVLGALLRVHPLTEAAALDVARLRPLTRAAGLSLGDRACLALARSLEVPVLTADRTWTKLHVGVKIESIR